MLLCSGGELLTYADLSGHAGPVRGLVWRDDQPPGRPILISGSEDQSVRAWDVVHHRGRQEQAALAAAGDAAAAAAAAPEPAATAAGAVDTSAGLPSSEQQPQLEQRGSGGVSAAAQRADPSSSAAGPAPGVPAAAAAALQPAATVRKGAAESLGARPLLPNPAAEAPDRPAALAASCLGLADALLGGGADAARLEAAGVAGCHADPLAASLALASSVDSLAARAAATGNPQARRSAAQHAAAVALWRGDVGEAVRLLLEHDALTADFVSMAAAAGEGAARGLRGWGLGGWGLGLGKALHTPFIVSVGKSLRWARERLPAPTQARSFEL